MNQQNQTGSRAAVRRRAWALAQRLLGPIFRRKYRFSCEHIPVDGPCLLIANHAANFDPILVSLSSRARPLSFVASEHLERLGLVSGLLTRYFSILPRSKASSGVGTVKSVLRALREGASVLLFAEGDCTWNGVSAGVFPATGKLARASGVPLVTYRLSGNYQSKPRWAKKARKGAIAGSVVRVYPPEELAAMSGEEITAAIDRDIFEDAWQNETVYRAGKPAEGLEQALFLCPDCGRPGSLHTRRDAIFCKSCGFRVTLDAGSHLQGSPFATIAQWDAWQEEAFAKRPSKASEHALFPGEGTLTELPGGSRRKVRFRLDLAGRALVVDEPSIPFAEISDIAMVKTDRLLFTHGGNYCEIHAKHAILRPYLLAHKQNETEIL